MAEISFEEDGGVSTPAPAWQKSGLAGLLQRLGIKDAYVNRVLLGIVVLAVVLSLILLLHSGVFSSNKPIVPPANVNLTQP